MSHEACSKRAHMMIFQVTKVKLTDLWFPVLNFRSFLNTGAILVILSSLRISTTF